MRTFSSVEFLEFLNAEGWIFSVEIIAEENAERVDGHDDDGAQIWTPYTYGCVAVVAKNGDVEITHSVDFQYNNFDADSLEYNESSVNAWQIEGAEIIDTDDDGDEEIINFSRFMDNNSGDYPADFTWHQNVVQVSEEPKDFDFVAGGDMEVFTLIVDNAPNIRFSGELIASESNSPDNGAYDFSGSTGRSQEFNLYKTAGGNYVCHIIQRSQWQGEKTRYKAAACKSIAEVIAFFGQSKMAKEIYAQANIDNVQIIE